MAEYEDWIEQDELDQESEYTYTPPVPQQRIQRPGQPSDPANRRSVVIHEKPSIPAKPKLPPAAPGRPKPPAPTSRSPGAAAQDTGTELEPVASPDRRASQSRLFPGVAIHSRTEKIQSGKKLEDYGMARKWPWAILGIFFMLGGFALCAFGGWCISQNPDGTKPPPTNTLDACGPGKVGGGIAMLMLGFIVVMVSLWQLYRLRDHRRRFLGFRDVV